MDALSGFGPNWSPYSFTQNNPLLFRDPFGLDTIRGKLLGDYHPQLGDIWINKKGQEAVYDKEDGWVQSQNLGEVTVKSSNGPSKSLDAVAFLMGLTDLTYNMYNDGYDHGNYTTTKGIVRLFPTTPYNRWSKQALKYKTRSNFVQGTGFTISTLSMMLTYVQVQKQYDQGGVSNVNPVDFTGLVLGGVGVTASGLKFLNVAPRTMSWVSEFAGNAAIPLAAYQNWMTAFQIMYNTNLPNANGYSGTAEQQFQAALDDAASDGNNW